MVDVARGGCVLTAAAMEADPAEWVEYVGGAVRRGHMKFVQWVLANVQPSPADSYIDSAVASGSLALLESLVEAGWSVTSGTVAFAGLSGNIALVQWLMNHGLAPTSDTIEGAVKEGHVHVLEWLMTKGYECTSDLLPVAVTFAKVHVVDWLFVHCDPPADVDLVELSCQNRWGSEVFEYLVDLRGLKCHPGICVSRSERWSLTFDAAVVVERYGVPLYPNYLKQAIELNDVRRVRFALSQGQQPTTDDYVELIDSLDATLLSEVLRARQVNGTLAEPDRSRIRHALRVSMFSGYTRELLSDHSFDP